MACQNAVFLAERLIVNSRLHHRTCFRCARCASQLSVANYYETEKGQYCCETCPDEVNLSQQHLPNDYSNEELSREPKEGPCHDPEEITLHDPEEITRYDPEEISSQVQSTKADSDQEQADEGCITPNPDSSAYERQDKADTSIWEATQDCQCGETQHNSCSSTDVALSSAHNEEKTLFVGSVLDDTSEAIEKNENDAVPCRFISSITNEEDFVDVTDPTNSTTEDHVTSTGCLEDASEQEETCDIESDGVVDCTVSSIAGNTGDPSYEEESDKTPDVSQTSEQVTDQIPVVPIPRRKSRRVESVVTPHFPIIVPEVVQDYPEDLNPFGDDSSEGDNGALPSQGDQSIEQITAQNPFGSDDEEDAVQVTLDNMVPKVCLNPFGSEDEEDDHDVYSDKGSIRTAQTKPERPPLPFKSDRSVSSKSLDMKSPVRGDVLRTSGRSVGPSPSPSKKRHAPPPPPKPGTAPSPCSTTVSMRRKEKPAPPPPGQTDLYFHSRDSVASTLSPNSVPNSPEQDKEIPRSREATPSGSAPTPAPRTILAVSPTPRPRLLKPVQERLSTDSESDICKEKSEKDLCNLNEKCSINKDSHGQWKRKKGPAPPRPMPQKRQLRKLSVKVIQQELEDIEVKQLELERQGVSLEQSIRSLTEPEDGRDSSASGIEVEEMILQLFDLVNEKNDLLRRQTELMYIRRQQRLEEEHAELEFQIRCLMEKPNGEKTDEDRLREEELIQRLIQVVHRRSEIVDCLEMDRRREKEEDTSIQQHLEVFNSRGATSGASKLSDKESSSHKTKSKTLKIIQAPIKLIKKDKLKKLKKVDADKDIDESENECSLKMPSTVAAPVEKEKKKSKSWFTK